MKKESNVADGERGDLADFLVTEVALELEVDHFALVRRKLLHGVVNPGECLARVVSFVEVAGNRELLVIDGGQAGRLLPRIQRKVAAYREQPGREPSFELPRVFPAQPQKGLLHDVPGRLQVAQEPLGVADQRPLVDFQRFGHPGGFRHPAHSVSMVDNDAAADLLDGATDRPSFVLCPWCLVLGPSLVLGPWSWVPRANPM